MPDPLIDCLVPEDRIIVQFPRVDEPRLRPAHLTLTNALPESCGYSTRSDQTYIIIDIPFIGCGTSREVCKIP